MNKLPVTSMKGLIMFHIKWSFRRIIYSVHWKLVCSVCVKNVMFMVLGIFFMAHTRKIPIWIRKNADHASNLGHPIFRCGHLHPLQIWVLLQRLRLQQTKRLPGYISMGPMDIDHVRHQHANRWCGRFVSSKHVLFSGSMLEHQGVKKNIPYSSYESIKEPNRFHSK